MKNKLLVGLAIPALFIGIAASASATTYAESGDAGQTLATAQMLPGGTSQITGYILDDADMFGFTWGGGVFDIDTFDSLISDTQLFLFDSAGVGIFANDDDPGGSGLLSALSTTLDPGNYFIGLSVYDYDPYDAGNNLIFPNSPFNVQHLPNSANPLAYWSGPSFTAGEYTITFNGRFPVDSNPVPEPATMLLLGTGLVGVAGAARRKKKNQA